MLRIHFVDNRQAPIWLVEERFTLGQDNRNNLVLSDHGVSAFHAEMRQENGLYYPVDFASSGSSQIGGNIGTNAGGIKVIRYGMTRNWVAGMKVVTGKGDLLELNNSSPAQETSGSGLGAGLAGEYDWDAHYQREFGQQDGKPDDTQGGSSQYR